MSQNDYDKGIKKLIEFLHTLQEDLAGVIKKSETLLPDYPSELRKLLESSFDVQKERFDRMRNYLNDRKLGETLLLDHGLLGVELNLKLELIKVVRGEAVNAEKAFNANKKEEDKKRWRILKGRVLEGSDIIMGSLAECGVPGAGALGEFKSVTEKLINWFRGRN